MRAQFDSVDRYIEGWLDGQACSYCEMVKRGVRLAGWMDAPNRHVARLKSLIVKEQCRVLVQRRQSGRAGIWIFRDARVARLIRSIEKSPKQSVAGVWEMGKLFGYGDADVLSFLDRHKRRLKA